MGWAPLASTLGGDRKGPLRRVSVLCRLSRAGELGAMVVLFEENILR